MAMTAGKVTIVPSSSSGVVVPPREEPELLDCRDCAGAHPLKRVVRFVFVFGPHCYTVCCMRLSHCADSFTVLGVFLAQKVPQSTVAFRYFR